MSINIIKVNNKPNWWYDDILNGLNDVDVVADNKNDDFDDDDDDDKNNNILLLHE